VGLLIAVLTRWLLTRLPAHPAGSALVLIVPFAAYVAADAAHGSGVLAVVTVALALSRYGDVESAQTRLVSGTTWEVIELLVTGAAFAFVGLELRAVAAKVSGPVDVLIGQALLVTAVVIAVRFVWIFAVASADERLRRRKDISGEPVGWREMTVASWAGMRGVVTLAAALALPLAAPGFPERERLIVVAFVVIIVTLLVQGLTMPFVVRRLGVITSEDERGDAEQDLLRQARDAGVSRLDDIRDRGDVHDDVLTHAVENADRMWHSLGFEPPDDHGDDSISRSEHSATVNALKEEVLAAAREAVVDARTQSGTDPSIVDAVLRRLDARGAQTD
jgi:CPA1 family monovalent cation:H+ antiporter